MEPTPAENVYATQLSRFARGHALYEPDPPTTNEVAQYKQFEVGDVGFIRWGCFYRLFNILLPADHASQRMGVPEGFERLLIPGMDHVDAEQVLSSICSSRVINPTAFPSSSVQESHADVQLSGPSIDIASFDGEISFSCSRRQGAVLVLPDQTVSYNVDPDLLFKDYILKNKNYERWYSFARSRGFDVKRVSDLVLVSGFDKTSEWGTAVFWDSETRTDAALGGGVTNCLTAKFVVGRGWSTSPSVLHRWGPQVPTSGVRNQCVFLRGFRVQPRFQGFFNAKPKLKAAAGPHDLGSGNRDNEGQSGVLSGSGTREYDSEDDDVDVETISDVPGDVNLMSGLLDYILEGSDADVAIVHDRDIFPYMRDTTELQDLNSALRRERPAIIVESGVGSLRTTVTKTSRASEHGLNDLKEIDAEFDSTDVLTRTGVLSGFHVPVQVEQPRSLNKPSSSSSNRSRQPQIGPSHSRQGDHLTHDPVEAPKRGESFDSKVGVGCWTCRLRRKKCDEQREGDSCQTCIRLKIECLGWGSKRPDWMRDKQAVQAYKNDIKAHLARQYGTPGTVQSTSAHHFEIESNFAGSSFYKSLPLRGSSIEPQDAISFHVQDAKKEGETRCE